MTEDLISRQAAIELVMQYCPDDDGTCSKADEDIRNLLDELEDLPSAQPEQQWIPVKTRPMTEEERQYWEENIDPEDEDAVIFDCQMPDDGQEVWVCYKSGTVSEDVCEKDNDFCGLEGNGDWLDIVAWMPRIRPEPYKEEEK